MRAVGRNKSTFEKVSFTSRIDRIAEIKEDKNGDAMVYDTEYLISEVKIKAPVVFVEIENFDEIQRFSVEVFPLLNERKINAEFVQIGNSASFVTEEENAGRIVDVIAELQKKFLGISTNVSLKSLIIFGGKEFAKHSGAVRFIQRVFDDAGISVKAIVPSQTRIACVVDETESEYISQKILPKLNISSV